MNKNSTLIIAAILLMFPRPHMIFPGTKGKILTPTVTGLGFIAIAFLGLRNK